MQLKTFFWLAALKCLGWFWFFGFFFFFLFTFFFF